MCKPKVMMKCRELSFSTRLCALVVVISWTTSLIFCSTECLEGDAILKAVVLGTKIQTRTQTTTIRRMDTIRGCPNDQTF